MIELTHPGEMLREDFLEPLRLPNHELAQALVSQTLRGRHDIAAETALLLDKFFGLSGGYWFQLQAAHDLRKAWRAPTERLTPLCTHADLY